MSGGEILNNKASYAGGVHMGGRASMSGGKISGNEAGRGGGVWVPFGGDLTMSGGEISGNTASRLGGGVHVETVSGTFTLSGSGKISGNEAQKGGGVSLDEGEFFMTGGEISGNTAQSPVSYDSGLGGGVYVEINLPTDDWNYIYAGIIDKTGGIIYGNEDAVDSGKRNTVKDKNGNPLIPAPGYVCGHAVFTTVTSAPRRYRDVTVTGVLLHYPGTPLYSGWVP
jgi:hypothetical protein